MILRPHRRGLVIWSQSAAASGRYRTASGRYRTASGGYRTASGRYRTASGGYRTAPVSRPSRASRIRRLIRLGVLLTVVSLLPLVRSSRGRWVVAGLVLTTAGIVYRANPAGVILLPGLLLVLGAPLVPASPKADRVRHAELERELAGYSTPAQRRDLEALLDGCPDGIANEIRDILAGQALAPRAQRIPGA